MELLGIHFNEIILIILLTISIGIFTVILFFINRSNDDSSNDSSINGQHGIKKKNKKKVNVLKSIKITESPDNDLVERRHDTRHIEIKSSPEILDDDYSAHSVFHPSLAPGKPILRKSDDEILISDHECLESTWTKIPRDEVEILRSRHSSVVSETRFGSKDDETRGESKLSRGQKKRLKAKLKTSDSVKQNNQFNNSSIVTDFPNYATKEPVESIINEDNANKSNKKQAKRLHEHTKTASFTSSESSHTSDKMHPLSSTENGGKTVFNNDFNEELQADNLDENTNNFNFQSFAEDFNDSEDKLNLEREIKQLKDERYGLLQKLNDCSSMATNIVALKKENELFAKKYDDLERTCNVMKKELSSTIQKHLTTESQFMRLKTECNQQRTFYENEISKLTIKINMLESDNNTKAREQDGMKNNMDKFHQMLSEKDKHIQNQGIELSSIKEQLYKKRMDYQDLEMQIKSVSMKLKETENQKQLGYEEIQRLTAQIEILKKEKNNIHKEFDKFTRQAKAQERQQDAIIASFQYQLDEFLREKQQAVFASIENEGRQSKSRVPDKEISGGNSTTIPDGYQLIESSTIAKFTTTINDANKRLQDKCYEFEQAITEYKDKESSLQDQNAELTDNYSKLNSEFESHLSEIVLLRQCIEKLERELSKNSDTTLEEMKLELDEKSETIRKTTDILTKLESSIDDDVKKLNESLIEKSQENLKLENELKSQASLVNNLNKKVIELKGLLQSYNNSENELLFNGASSVGFSETFDQ